MRPFMHLVSVASYTGTEEAKQRIELTSIIGIFLENLISNFLAFGKLPLLVSLEEVVVELAVLLWPV
jgi:hypothetical protein